MKQESTSASRVKARLLNISRSTLFYTKKRPEKDWKVKCEIEQVLRQHPSYGSRRIAIHLKKNRKGIQRVMQVFGIKAYRRRARKYLVKRMVKVIYPNLLLTTFPAYPHHIWATDFTELWWKEKKVYLATVIDLYTREIVGISLSTRKGVQLTAAALWNALLTHPRPLIFHSDNGSEYRARAFIAILKSVGSLISRSAPGCPWENGYQESFYDKFKIDLGDTNRFSSFGELIAEVYRHVWVYNHTRIHTALKMAPAEFAKLHALNTIHSIV